MSFTLLLNNGGASTRVATIDASSERGALLVAELNQWVAAQIAEHPEVPAPTPDDDRSIAEWSARKTRIDTLVPPTAEAGLNPAVIDAARGVVLWAEGTFAMRDALPREQWLDRCTARFCQEAGLPRNMAFEMAESQLESLNDDLSEDPVQAADDEMSCWTAD